MALSENDKAEIVALVRELFATNASGGVEPVIDPEPGPSLGGPIAEALRGLMKAEHYAWAMNEFAASRGNKFRRTDVYDLLVYLIDEMQTNGEPWIVGNESTWQWTKEALMTRSSELSGDAMTTEWPVIESSAAFGGIDYGVTEHLANLLDLALRKMIGAYVSQTSDSDLGPDGESLSSGDQLRICENLLDFLTGHKVVPDDEGSAFRRVRYEIRDQYRAMGEGVFAPWSHPGGSVPWSWGG